MVALSGCWEGVDHHNWVADCHCHLVALTFLVSDAGDCIIGKRRKKVEKKETDRTWNGYKCGVE